MKPKPTRLASYQTLDSVTRTADGQLAFRTLALEEQKPGFSGTLVPYYTLSDRGTFFIPGSAKKTIKEQTAKAQLLWQHDPWAPIGKFSEAFEDDTGFQVKAEVVEGVQQGAEAMSLLRSGVPLGLSVGWDPVADRTGTPADDKKLDRSTAPEYLHTIPINELRAITEFKWIEGSIVTWGGIATAKPNEIYQSVDDALQTLLTGLKDGTLAAEQLATVEELVAAHAQLAAAGSDHGTSADEARRRNRQIEIAARIAAYQGLVAQEFMVA